MGELPKHIAIVMDGNGRWANRRKLPRIAGHRAGSKTVRKVVEHCAKKGIEVLTLFAFSIENRGRPSTEVRYLMKLMLESLQRNTAQLHENNVRLRIIGERSYFDEPLLRQIVAAEELTKNNSGLTLVVAINYSGRWDIAQATQKLLQSGASYTSADEVENALEKHLSLCDLPEPDLLIRTSGEQRISNFMLWQFAYTEIYFTEAFWPDFNEEMLEQAITFFCTRQRRFGLTPEQVISKYA